MIIAVLPGRPGAAMVTAAIGRGLAAAGRSVTIIAPATFGPGDELTQVLQQNPTADTFDDLLTTDISAHLPAVTEKPLLTARLLRRPEGLDINSAALSDYLDRLVPFTDVVLVVAHNRGAAAGMGWLPKADVLLVTGAAESPAWPPGADGLAIGSERRWPPTFFLTSADDSRQAFSQSVAGPVEVEVMEVLPGSDANVEAWQAALQPLTNRLLSDEFSPEGRRRRIADRLLATLHADRTPTAAHLRPEPKSQEQVAATAPPQTTVSAVPTPESVAQTETYQQRPSERAPQLQLEVDRLRAEITAAEQQLTEYRRLLEGTKEQLTAALRGWLSQVEAV